MPLVGHCPPRLHPLHLSVLFLKNYGHILPNLEIQYLDVILNFSSIKLVFLVSATALLGINKVVGTGNRKGRWRKGKITLRFIYLSKLPLGDSFNQTPIC